MNDNITEAEYTLAGFEGFSEFNSKVPKEVVALVKKIAVQPSAKGSRKQLLERLSQLPEKTLQAIIDGKLQMVEHAFYATKSVEAVNRVELFKGNDDVAVGFCNIAKKKFERHFLLSGIRMEYHTGGAAITASNSNLFTPSAVPVSVLNGELSMSASGKDIIKEFPLSSLYPGLHPSDSTVPAVTSGPLQAAHTRTASFAYANGKQYGYLELENPKLFSPEDTIDVALEFGQSLSATHHAFRFLMYGTILRPI